MKPIVLMTVYRRYFELEQNLKVVHERFSELSQKPVVILVWANPVVGHLWFMNGLIEQGKVDRVLGRPFHENEKESRATTYSESLNIRHGLEYIKQNYDESYVIFQAADVEPVPGAYRFIEARINEGEKAVLYHWENNCCREDIWNTNFFVVPLDETYWPPISTPDSHDVLERQWGQALAKARPERIYRWHNSRSQTFLHHHLSDSHEPWPLIPITSGASINLCIKGYKSPGRKILDFCQFLGGFIKWLLCR